MDLSTSPFITYVHLPDLGSFSVISFSTVGFGERFVEAENVPKLIAAIAFLVWGIVLTTSLFATLSNLLYKVTAVNGMLF